MMAIKLIVIKGGNAAIHAGLARVRLGFISEFHIGEKVWASQESNWTSGTGTKNLEFLLLCPWFPTWGRGMSDFTILF